MTALHNAIAAVCPIIGISVGTMGDSASVRIDYAGNATEQERAAAQAVLAAFNWNSPDPRAAKLAEIEATLADTPLLADETAQVLADLLALAKGEV